MKKKATNHFPISDTKKIRFEENHSIGWLESNFI